MKRRIEIDDNRVIKENHLAIRKRSMKIGYYGNYRELKRLLFIAIDNKNPDTLWAENIIMIRSNLIHTADGIIWTAKRRKIK